MSATIHRIKSRTKDHPARRALREDFELDEGTAVSTDRVLAEPGWSLYCLHLATRQAVWVHTPPQAKLTEAPFLRMDQFTHATRVLLMHWEDLGPLAAAVPLPQNLVFVFGIGRSGTTLVSHMLGRVENVVSLSEPNVQFDATVHRHANGPSVTRELIIACTRLLCRQPDGSVPKTIVFKLYSQSLFNCLDYFAGFPAARYVFLYRDGESWANSFYKMTRGYGSPEVLDQAARDRIWSVVSANQDIAILKKSLPPGSTEYHHEDIAAASLALHFETYLDCLNAGVPFLALRHNEMLTDPKGTTMALLTHCGLPSASLDSAMQGLARDSQDGSGIGQDNRIQGYTPERFARFRAALARQDKFTSPDFLLPDINNRHRSG